MRFVFDTNTIVSALLFEQSVPGRAFHAALGRGNVLLSQSTVAELVEVLERKKFERYVTAEERRAFIALLLTEASIIDATDAIRACRDPKDDKFLSLSVCGVANRLVTGDRDLLALDPFQGVPILTPSRFPEWLSQASPDQT